MQEDAEPDLARALKACDWARARPITRALAHTRTLHAQLPDTRRGDIGMREMCPTMEAAKDAPQPPTLAPHDGATLHALQRSADVAGPGVDVAVQWRWRVSSSCHADGDADNCDAAELVLSRSAHTGIATPQATRSRSDGLADDEAEIAWS